MGMGARINQPLVIDNYNGKLLDVLFCIKQIYLVNQVLLETSAPTSTAPTAWKKVLQNIQSSIFDPEKLPEMVVHCAKFISESCEGKYPPLNSSCWLTFFSIFRDAYGHIAYGYFSPDDEEDMPRPAALLTVELIRKGYAGQILRSSFKQLPSLLAMDDEDVVLMALEWIGTYTSLLDIAPLMDGIDQVKLPQYKQFVEEVDSEEIRNILIETRATCERYASKVSEGSVRRMTAFLAITGLDFFEFGRPIPEGMAPLQQMFGHLAIAIGSYTEYAQEALRVQEKPATSRVFHCETKFLSPMWILYSVLGMKFSIWKEMMNHFFCGEEELRSALKYGMVVPILDFATALAAAHAVLSPLKSKFYDKTLNGGNLRVLVIPVFGFPVVATNILSFSLNIQAAEQNPHPPGSPALEAQLKACMAATQATCKDALIHLAMSREEIKASYTHGVSLESTPSSEEAIITQIFLPAELTLGIASKYLLEYNIGSHVMDAPEKHRRKALHCFYKCATSQPLSQGSGMTSLLRILVILSMRALLTL